MERQLSYMYQKHIYATQCEYISRTVHGVNIIIKKSNAFPCAIGELFPIQPLICFFFLRANWLVVNNNIGDTQHPEEAIVEPLVRMTGYQIHSSPESIEWFIVGQAFWVSYDLAPPTNTPPSSVNSTGDTKEDWERETTCPREKGGRGAMQIIWRRESLALYKSLSTLCTPPRL